MRSIMKTVLTFALVALLATPALAQRGQGQRQRPQQGFGQFRMSKSMLLSNEGVQKELKITDDQKKKLEENQRTQREEMQKAFREAGMDREKIQKAMQELREKSEKATNEVLTDTQKKRLNQIYLQALRARAFKEEEVVKALKITDEQKKAIDEAIEAGNKKIQEETRNLGRQDFEKRREVTDKINKETFSTIAGKLTAEQKKAWKDLIGEPFEVKFERRGGGGGGRPNRPNRDVN